MPFVQFTLSGFLTLTSLCAATPLLMISSTLSRGTGKFLSRSFWLFCENLMLIYSSYRNYIPCIYLLNKIDQISIEELEIITKVSSIKITFASPKGSLSSPFYHRPVFWNSAPSFLSSTDSTLCPDLCASQMELWQPSWEDVGLSEAGIIAIIFMTEQRSRNYFL